MNIQFLSKWFESKEMLGCDIGAAGLKFVCLERNNSHFSLKAAGIFEADFFSGGDVPIRRAEQFLSENGLSGKSSAINIEDRSLRIRRMDIPEMPDSDIKIAIRWNFREFVDGPIEKFAVSYTSIGGRAKGEAKRPLMAFAVSNTAVEEAVKRAKRLGLKAIAVEPNATALLAAFDLNTDWVPGKRYALIDLGGKTANFVVLSDGILLFSRPLAGISFGPEAPPESLLSQLVIEIQRSIDAFCLMYSVEKVDEIHLCGGGSLFTGIASYAAKNLGIETFIFNPFKNIDMSSFKGRLDKPELFAVAVGLAIPNR